MLRVQLISPKVGTLVIKKDDPDGLNDLEQVIKRSEVGDGVVRSAVVELRFIKLGKQFLEQAVALKGPDTNVLCNIFEYNNETRLFDILYFSGKVNFNGHKKDENFFSVTIEESGFQRAILNNMSKDVDVETTTSILNTDITAIVSNNLRLHSKRILYQFNGTGQGDFVGINVPVDQYLTIDPADVTLNEIKTKQSLGINVMDQRPDPMWVMEEDGEYDFFIYVENNNGGGTLMANVDVYYSINGNADVPFLRIDDTDFRTGWTLNTTFTFKKGDSFRWYFKNHGTTDQFVNINTFTPNSPLRVFISNLSTSPDSVTKAFFMRDVIQQCVRYYTGINDCFKSSLLNRTELGGADGAGALDFTVNGNLIRTRDKKLFWNLKDASKTVESIYCAAYGFEIGADNIERYVLEGKDYFYDKSSFSVDLGSVYDIEYTLNYDRLFNNFVLGYTTQIDIGQINAIDGFNTIRKYILNLINSSNNIDISIPAITDGYQIEYQRRLITSTADGRYDDKNFLIKGYRDAGYRAAKDDGYDSITGIVDSATGYNYDLSPARILQRWKKVLAACLLYAENKTVNFSSGTGNYEMVTQKTSELAIAENGSLDLAGIDSYTTPYDIKFGCKTTTAQFTAIKLNPYKYIQLRNLNGVNIQGFISKDGISHNASKKTGEFNLMEVYRK